MSMTRTNLYNKLNAAIKLGKMEKIEDTYPAKYKRL